MHLAATRFRTGALTSTFVLALAASVNAASTAKEKTITISEGTDVFITVSPDHKTIIADLQGLLFSVPIGGGVAKQITTPHQEASHPDWSAKGDLIAIQSYAGGTFHIWTMHPDGSGLKQITNGHGDDREPRISPGRHLHRLRIRPRLQRQLRYMDSVNISTGELKQITFAEADEFSPAMYPPTAQRSRLCQWNRHQWQNRRVNRPLPRGIRRPWSRASPKRTRRSPQLFS